LVFGVRMLTSTAEHPSSHPNAGVSQSSVVCDRRIEEPVLAGIAVSAVVELARRLFEKYLAARRRT